MSVRIAQRNLSRVAVFSDMHMAYSVWFQLYAISYRPYAISQLLARRLSAPFDTLRVIGEAYEFF